MSSIVTSVLNATIGWLVAKGRDVTAEKLKEGDVTDQKIHDLIVREVKDIKTKLDGITRNDLLTAVAISSGRSSAELAQVTTTIKRGNDDEFCLSSSMEVVKTVSVAVESGNIELTKIDDIKNVLFIKPEGDSKRLGKKRQTPPTMKLSRRLTS